MKKLLIITTTLALVAVNSIAQEFTTAVATAKTAYAAGKLEDAHFALQQMLMEIDITIGKEVLKLLPVKMETLTSIAKNDQVTGNISFVGATIHRTYGTADKTADIDIVNNSPLLGTINAFLSSPMLVGLASDGKTKVIKVQGYKSRITKEEGEAGKINYRLEIPFSNALITLFATNTTDTETLAMANTLPLEKIAALIQ